VMYFWSISPWMTVSTASLLRSAGPSRKVRTQRVFSGNLRVSTCACLSRGRRCGWRGRFLFGCGFCELCVNISGFHRVNGVVIVVRFRQFVFAREQRVEALALTQFKYLVHFDGLKMTNLDADLAI